jgi:predicted nucleotidyltransferase
MNTIIRKNRIRQNRGKLKVFNDLPENVKLDFKLIKEEINKKIEGLNLYVFGSYYWGFWDDESDYDINIDIDEITLSFDERIKLFKEIKDTIREKYKIKLDIISNRGEKGILIP